MLDNPLQDTLTLQSQPLQKQHGIASFSSQWIALVAFYLLTWVSLYLELPAPVRILILLVMVGFSLRSFQMAAALFLLTLFMPYFTEFMGFKISGVNSMRIMSLPFLFFAFHKPQIRHLKVNKVMILLLFITLISIVMSAEIRKLIQDIPVSEASAPGPLNFIARSLDMALIFIFIYIILTRMENEEIANMFDLLLLCGLLESLVIIFLVIQRPESIIGEQFDKYYLWRNPYFGHKNDWGMMLVFIVLATYIKRKISDHHKNFYMLVMIICTLGVIFSLSRQAYVSLMLGFILISVLQGNMKPTLYLTLALILLLTIQPAFLFDRIESFVNVSSLEEFQGLSRKVGDLAVNQFKSNLTFIPRMFFSGYEYNWSEGFWNGLTHQQGIPGLLFQIFFYIYLIHRYFIISKSNVYELSYLGTMMCVFLVIVFISNFNRRGINYMHYDGKIEQFSFILIYFTFMAEYVLFHYKELLSRTSE